MSDAPVTAAAPAPEASAAPAPEVPATSTQPAAPEPPRGPSPAELRAQLLQEKLQQMRAQKAERRQAEDYSAKAKAAEEAAAKARAEAERWQSASKDPMKLLSELGVAPEVLYQQLTDHLLGEQTPEAHQRRLEKMIEDKVQKVNPEIEEVRKALEEHKAELARIKAAEQERQQRLFLAEKAARESEMIKHLKASEYEELSDYYTDEQLLAASYQVAEHLYKQGEDYSYGEVARHMLNIHRQWQNGVEQRRAAKRPPPPKEEAAPSREEPRAIGNDITSAVAASEDSPKMSRKEAAAKRAKALADLLKSNG